MHVPIQNLIKYILYNFTFSKDWRKIKRLIIQIFFTHVFYSIQRWYNQKEFTLYNSFSIFTSVWGHFAVLIRSANFRLATLFPVTAFKKVPYIDFSLFTLIFVYLLLFKQFKNNLHKISSIMKEKYTETTKNFINKYHIFHFKLLMFRTIQFKFKHFFNLQASFFKIISFLHVTYKDFILLRKIWI